MKGLTRFLCSVEVRVDLGPNGSNVRAVMDLHIEVRREPVMNRRGFRKLLIQDVDLPRKECDLWEIGTPILLLSLGLSVD